MTSTRATVVCLSGGVEQQARELGGAGQLRRRAFHEAVDARERRDGRDSPAIATVGLGAGGTDST